MWRSRMLIPRKRKTQVYLSLLQGLFTRYIDVKQMNKQEKSVPNIYRNRIRRGCIVCSQHG